MSSSSLPSPAEARALALAVSTKQYCAAIDGAIKARIDQGHFDCRWTIPFRVESDKDPILVELLKIYAPYHAQATSYCLSSSCDRDCSCPDNNTLVFSW